MPNVNNIPQKTDTRVSIEDIKKRQTRNFRNIKVVSKKDNGLDRNSFLKLLVKELSNQDPLQPVNDKEFISQMAQFSSLEQMHNVAKSVEKLTAMQANNLVGKHVVGKDFVTHKPVAGIVTRVMHDAAGATFLTVNGRRIKVSDLQSVFQPQVSNRQQQPQNITNVSRETINQQKPATKIMQPDAKSMSSYKENQQQVVNSKQQISLIEKHNKPTEKNTLQAGTEK